MKSNLFQLFFHHAFLWSCSLHVKYGFKHTLALCCTFYIVVSNNSSSEDSDSNSDSDSESDTDKDTPKPNDKHKEKPDDGSNQSLQAEMDM